MLPAANSCRNLYLIFCLTLPNFIEAAPSKASTGTTTSVISTLSTSMEKFQTMPQLVRNSTPKTCRPAFPILRSALENYISKTTATITSGATSTSTTVTVTAGTAPTTATTWATSTTATATTEFQVRLPQNMTIECSNFAKPICAPKNAVGPFTFTLMEQVLKQASFPRLNESPDLDLEQNKFKIQTTLDTLKKLVVSFLIL